MQYNGFNLDISTCCCLRGFKFNEFFSDCYDKVESSSTYVILSTKI